jgi:tryptophan 2,3-dioxygenase
VLKTKEVTTPTQANEELQNELLKLYKQRSEMITVFELMLDLDEGLQEWRYRHVKMVERTIGQKYGTGGSPGVDFLKRTLFLPLFPDLWAIRHRM